MKIHNDKPERKCTKTFSKYTSFKPYIREDFKYRCGYCGDLDYYHGGYRGYQIDHFKPHSIKKFESLKETYSNLVYSCPFCNRAKSNKWKDKDGFIDPCTNEYDNHLYRDTCGSIKYSTSQGEYIHKNLNLTLKRHRLLWCIEKLEEQNKKLILECTRLGAGHDKELDILRKFMLVQKEINDYTKLFREEL